MGGGGRGCGVNMYSHVAGSLWPIFQDASHAVAEEGWGVDTVV